MQTPAGFIKRLIAYIIDSLIIGIPAGLIVVFLGNAVGDAAGALINLIAGIYAVGYYLYFWSTTGQTPGKSVMGIKIVNYEGEPLTIGKAILRLIGYWIGTIIAYLGFIWIIFDSNKQGWHDKLAGSYVVEA